MADVGNKGTEIMLRNAAKDLHRKAELVGGKLQSIAESIAKKHGAKVTPINYKSVDSIVRKAKTENNGIKDIKDSYRTTIIASKDAIPKIINELKGNFKDFTFVRHKAQNLDTGYSGNIINVKNKKTGLVGEIQVNTAKMIYAKENYSVAYKILGGKTMRSIYNETKMPAGWGHSLYEQSRVITKYRRKVQENSKYSKLQNMQKAYYKKFQ